MDYNIATKLKYGELISHSKNPEVLYEVCGVGKYKMMGRWIPCVTYQSIDGELYTRACTLMQKFTKVNK